MAAMNSCSVADGIVGADRDSPRVLGSLRSRSDAIGVVRELNTWQTLPVRRLRAVLQVVVPVSPTVEGLYGSGCRMLPWAVRGRCNPCRLRERHPSGNCLGACSTASDCGSSRRIVRQRKLP